MEEPSEPLICDPSDEQNLVETESLCMQCYEKGVSRFLLTRIPHFRDVVIAAFECPHCGQRNNEIQSTTSIASKGLKQTCIVSSTEDLNRQVVVSEHGTIFLPEIELEVPPNHEKGYLSTIEGIVRRIHDDLAQGQSQRQNSEVETFAKIGIILQRLEEMVSGVPNFTFVLDDPSGNSYIENLQFIGSNHS